MTDIIDRQTRSRMMSGIRGKNTKPELALRRSLHALGFRYRPHVKGIPGKPDIVMPKYRAVIFVHGCFWHRHAGCRYATVPATRPEFWAAKFDANVVRDAAVQSALWEAGWRIVTVWECALRTKTSVTQTRDMAAAWLHGADGALEVGEVEVRNAPCPEPTPGGRKQIGFVDKMNGLSPATFYRLKRLLADVTLDNVVLKDLLGRP